MSLRSMHTLIAAALLALCGMAQPASAHRLDEYLQAATFSLDRDSVAIRLRMTPGVATVDQILPAIDTDGDGTISNTEQRAYRDKVKRDLSVSVNGQAATLQTGTCTFPRVDDLKAGLGDIVLEFKLLLPTGSACHKLRFENHHQSALAIYLANCLVPSEPDIRVIAQSRSYNQSSYQLDFTTATKASTESVAISQERSNDSPKLSIVQTFFTHGVVHILTGYDHLLFISALVLAATTLWDLVKVVTAFTLAHCLTLTLAALNLVHVSDRFVEPLISASIVFVAIQNVIWPHAARGKARLAVAFFFGLFHGLGFAGGLLDLMHQMNSTTILLALVGFSLGVEAGHQMVLLPLFTLLKMVRVSRANFVARTRLAMAVQRVGSAGISLAGVYYLSLALLSA